MASTEIPKEVRFEMKYVSTAGSEALKAKYFFEELVQLVIGLKFVI